MSNQNENLKKFVAKIKVIEPILLGILLVSLLLKFWRHMPVSILIIISAATLAQFNVFKAQLSREDLNAQEKFLSKMFYFLLAIGFVAALFRIQNWPGFRSMSTVFLGGSTFVIVAFVAFVKRSIVEIFTVSELIQYICVLLFLVMLYFVK